MATLSLLTRPKLSDLVIYVCDEIDYAKKIEPSFLKPPKVSFQVLTPYHREVLSMSRMATPTLLLIFYMNRYHIDQIMG